MLRTVSMAFAVASVALTLALLRAVQQGEDRGNEDQGGDRRGREAADDGAAERRILLAAFAQRRAPWESCR